MFDVGFTELFLISVIALIVIGPERLPSAARTAGAWLGRMKRMFNNVKYDVQRELQAEELRKSVLGEQAGELKDFGKALTEDILNPTSTTQAKPAEGESSEQAAESITDSKPKDDKPE